MVAAKRQTFGDVERLHMTRTLAEHPLYWTSVYRVGDALIDSGCSTGRRAFVGWLREKPIRLALATHEHEDHVGNHAVLPEGTTSYGPALTKRFLDGGHPPFPLYRRFVWGYHERAPGTHLVPDKVEGFRVVQTNGHSADHVSYLHEATNAVFTGDAYMGKFRAARLEEDVHTGLDSLRRLADVDAAVMYPAHGPVVERPRAKLLDTIAYFEGLWQKASAMRERGMTERRIARELLGGPGFLTLFSTGEFSEAKLILNLLRRPFP